MIERAFEIGDGEGVVAKSPALGNTAQRAGQLRGRRVKFKDELAQIAVFGFFDAQFVALAPDLHRAFMAAVLERMAEIAMFGSDPVNAFTMRFGFGRRFIGSFFARAIG
jgi:hypothetical protein